MYFLAAQIGDVVKGTVQSVKPYGAFLEIGQGVNGLLHISQISEDRVTNVDDVLSVGDELKVSGQAQHVSLWWPMERLARHPPI